MRYDCSTKNTNILPNRKKMAKKSSFSAARYASPKPMIHQAGGALTGIKTKA